MINLKKLVASFLILASLAGFGTLIFFNLNSRKNSPSETAETLKPPIQPSPIGAISQNAFVEKIPEAQRSAFLGNYKTGIEPSSAGSYNFTEQLAQDFAQEFVAANPNGPADLGGELALVSPDNKAMERVVRRITNDLSNLEDKVFNTESIPDGEVKIIKNYTQGDTLNYLNSLTNIVNQTVRSQFDTLNEKEMGPETVAASQLIFDQAVQNLKSLSVPSPLVKPQKAILQALTNQKRIAEAITSFESDPAKILLITQESIEKIVNRDIQNFVDQLQESSGSGVISNNKEKKFLIASINKFFFVNYARAQFGLPSGEDLTTLTRTGAATATAVSSGGNFLQRLLQWAKQLATEILKDQIIGQLVNNVINWVNRGGQGKIVDNWQTFLSGSFDRAAGFTIEKIVPGLCQSFGPLIKLSLQEIQNTPVTETRCTLSQVVQNISSFYNNFLDRGVQLGWASYGSLIRFDGGNFHGTLLVARDEVIAQGAAAREAANTEAETSGGFLSTKVCPAGTTKIGENKCSDGSVPLVTTPGGSIAHSVDTALGAGVHRIVNSTDVIALVSALVNTALNRLVGAGVNGLRGL